MEFTPKPLPVVVMPLEDECLGSWIGRLGAYYGISVSTLLKTIHLPLPCNYLKNWLLLRPINLSDALTIAKACRHSKESIASMVPSTGHILHYCELGICVHCLAEDHANGRPIYWRRKWLDAVSVVCDRHESCLIPIESNIFRCYNNWTGIETQLLKATERVLRDQETNKILDSFDKTSPFLQWLFCDELAQQIAGSRYRLDVVSARQVASDLLDALLYVNPAEQRSSALHEYAWYLKIPFDNQQLSIHIRSNHVMSLSRVQSLEVRAFAIAVTDAIMFSRVRWGSPHATENLTETSSFWTSSLWAFLPKCSVELLSLRAQNWPSHYTQTCWPELRGMEKIAMSQSSKKTLRSMIIQENALVIKSKLADIRSN